jgi:hypothetical protein
VETVAKFRLGGEEEPEEAQAEAKAEAGLNPGRLSLPVPA